MSGIPQDSPVNYANFGGNYAAIHAKYPARLSEIRRAKILATEKTSVPVNVNLDSGKPIYGGFTRTVGDFPRLEASASMSSCGDHSYASVARSRNPRHSTTQTLSQESMLFNEQQLAL